jgi:hypothetical protein
MPVGCLGLGKRQCPIDHRPQAMPLDSPVLKGDAPAALSPLLGDAQLELAHRNTTYLSLKENS